MAILKKNVHKKEQEATRKKQRLLGSFYDVYLLVVSFWIMAACTLTVTVVSQKHTASDVEVTCFSAKRYLSTKLHSVCLLILGLFYKTESIAVST
jgi:hypothetical protein